MKPKTLSSAIKTLAFSLLLKMPKAAFLYVPVLTFTAFFGGAYWLLELTTHFRFQYFVLSFFFLLVFALIRMWRWAGVALLCLFINSAFILPWYLTVKSVRADSGGQKLRLLLTNVLWDNKTRPAVINMARREQPDLAFFQEVTSQWATELEVLRSDFPYYRLDPAEDAGGLASFSRIPFVQAKLAPLTEYNGPAAIFQINIGGKLVSIVSVHAPPPAGKENFDNRTEILKQTAEFVNTLPEPKIVIGDLNMTMWSPYYKRFIENTGLVNAREGFGVLPSWPTFLPPMSIPIDQCLVSQGIQVVNIRTGSRVGSDHLPLIVDLVIP